ncbi:MAG: SpoIIE family protein phosphatase [bacterium]|nr:SpoIIE family protein phosphatase [bacterium]MCM1374474.1 SpoIIE family protein phosphatase [Muribaculum sp.]
MLTTAGRERQEQLSMMLSDYGRGRLLAYADSFRELSRSYRGANPYRQREWTEGTSRQQVLEAQSLWENRQMLCDNLNEMSQIMAKIAGEVFQLSPLPLREEKLIIRALKQEGITVRELFYMEQPRQCDCEETEDDRKMAGAALGLHMQSQRMVGHSSQEIADMLSVLLGRRLIVSVTSPRQIEGREGIYLFVEEPRFVMLSGSARAVKESETVSGDNYSIVQSDRGWTTVLLSDGMGCGEEASADSSQVLEMMERMLEAGFETDMAVSLVNSALMATGNISGRRNMSTLDICSLNLYQGMCVFRKIGGAASFLKSNSYVEQISLPGLPLGILPTGAQEDAQGALCQSVSRELIDNDYIIMVSDGVLDALRHNGYENAMIQYLESMREQHPEEMAGNLLQYVLRCSQGRIVDDMTILVLGVFDSHR